MPDYIPKLATIEQSCEWLRSRLGGVWILPRLLECHLKPYFWIDYKPGYPQILGGKVEGYLTWMIFASDVQRLEVDGTNALVNMFTAHDGTPVKVEPGWTVPLTELRFKREALQRVASILEGKVSPQNPAPSGASEKAAPPVPVVPPAALLAGVPAAEILEKFKLDSAWAEKLKHIDRNPFLKKSGALLQQGCRKSATSNGMPNLFSPVKFAEMLMAREGKTSQQMKRIIENRFKPWQDEWDAAQSIDAPDEWDE